MKRAIKLIIKEGTTFDLYFLNGRVKRYNILSLADKFPQLNLLKNRKLFESAQLMGWSGVYWNDELDVDCDTVYSEGKDVTKEYDDVETVIVGYLIKQRRVRAGLTQKELAQICGIDQSDISKIEKGIANPSVRTLIRIANGLDSKLDIVIGKK